MDHPLYGAALFLNPGKYFPIVESGDDALIGELRSCFNDVLAKMVLDVNTRNKIDAQAVLYEGKRGAFANVMAIDNMSKRNPRKSTQVNFSKKLDNFSKLFSIQPPNACVFLPF
jgi:hypothetical protein